MTDAEEERLLGVTTWLLGVLLAHVVVTSVALSYVVEGAIETGRVVAFFVMLLFPVVSAVLPLVGAVPDFPNWVWLPLMVAWFFPIRVFAAIGYYDVLGRENESTQYTRRADYGNRAGDLWVYYLTKLVPQLVTFAIVVAGTGMSAVETGTYWFVLSMRLYALTLVAAGDPVSFVTVPLWIGAFLVWGLTFFLNRLVNTFIETLAEQRREEIREGAA